ncbi:MAG TPA: FecR domain-containing protein [Caulobacteraceae bacterium]|nr:FecR domain-containing protein [Caulobacteraceae bacterium]
MSVSDENAATPRRSGASAGVQPTSGPLQARRLWPAAILAGAIVLGLWGPNLVRPPPPAWTLYTSLKGQTRRVRLADKSLLWMDGAAAVRVVFDDRSRLAVLDGGEAEMAVAPASRPFAISVGDRRVSTRDGDLDLSRYPQQGQVVTTLTVRRGEAEVGQVGATGDPWTLRAGDQIRWVDGQAADAARRVNPEAAFAWQRRELVFNREPLANVAASLNRYIDRPIVIPQAAVGQIRFTGALAIDREDRILKRLEAALPIQADIRRDSIVLRGRSHSAAKAARPPERHVGAPIPGPSS